MITPAPIPLLFIAPEELTRYMPMRELPVGLLFETRWQWIFSSEKP